MEENGEDPGPGWLKRLRWSRTGIAALDQRIDTVLSLWAEGNLRPVDLAAEVREVIERHSQCPRATAESDMLDVCAKNVQIAAQWLAVIDVMHFCEEHEWRSTEDKVYALRCFAKELDRTSQVAGASGRSWIAAACEYRSRTEDVNDPMHLNVTDWMRGGVFENHDQVLEEIQSAEDWIGDARVSNLGSPQDAIKNWVDLLRARVQGVVLREADAYCRTNGLDTPEDRARVWKSLLKTIQHSSPGSAPPL